MIGLIDVVGAELRKLGDEGPTAHEVNRSKAQLKAGLLMGLESSSARAEQMARHLLVHGRLLPSEELIAKVDAVGDDDIRAFAARVARGRPSVAVVGAGKRSPDFAAHAACFAGA